MSPVCGRPHNPCLIRVLPSRLCLVGPCLDSESKPLSQWFSSCTVGISVSITRDLLEMQIPSPSAGPADHGLWSGAQQSGKSDACPRWRRFFGSSVGGVGRRSTPLFRVGGGVEGPGASCADAQPATQVPGSPASPLLEVPGPRFCSPRLRIGKRWFGVFV